MANRKDDGLLLGRQTPPVQAYSPDILYAIPRSTGRAALGLPGPDRFYGIDLWHAYELSWLDAAGKPVSRVGRFLVPAASPNIVESKSFKLYLNSLNARRFQSEEEAVRTMVSDLSAVAGVDITLQLFAADDPALAGSSLEGRCIDELQCAAAQNGPAPDMLVFAPDTEVEERLYSHLMRSLCPVTGQPDWASVWLHYRGPALEPESLLRYVLSFREHQEFHEPCVERMFCDILLAGSPRFLQVQAFYTRRGGLDINPMRCTEPSARALPRLNRQ